MVDRYLFLEEITRWIDNRERSYSEKLLPHEGLIPFGSVMATTGIDLDEYRKDGERFTLHDDDARVDFDEVMLFAALLLTKYGFTSEDVLIELARQKLTE